VDSRRGAGIGGSGCAGCWGSRNGSTGRSDRRDADGAASQIRCSSHSILITILKINSLPTTYLSRQICGSCCLQLIIFVHLQTVYCLKNGSIIVDSCLLTKSSRNCSSSPVLRSNIASAWRSWVNLLPARRCLTFSVRYFKIRVCRKSWAGSSRMAGWPGIFTGRKARRYADPGFL
jgi:hypothetical protein